MKKIIKFIMVLAFLNSQTSYSQAYVRWQRDSGTTSRNYTCEMVIDSSGNVYTSRTNYSGEDWFITTTKYDSTGNIKWEKHLADLHIDPTVSKLAVDNSGNVYLATIELTLYYEDLSAYKGRGWIIIKYDSVGIRQWDKSFPMETPEYTNLQENICDLIIDKEGNVCVTGALTSGYQTENAAILKLSPNGSVLWFKYMNINIQGIDANEYPCTMGLDSESNLFISGRYQGTGVIDDISSYFCGVFTCKYDSNGNLQWKRIYQLKLMAMNIIDYLIHTMTEQETGIMQVM